MRWITFFVLLYFMSALQVSHLGGIPTKTGVGTFIEYLPVLAIFYALYASEAAAPLAALFCGLMYDIFNRTFIGTSLVPLALVTLLIVRVRLLIFREHFLSQVVVTLLGVMAFGLFGATFAWLIGAPLLGHSVFTQFGVVAANALYTAIVAPALFFLMFRFRHILGFKSHGPRARG